MRKYKKFSVLFIVTLLLISGVVHAENTTAKDSFEAKKGAFQAERDVLKNKLQTAREEFRGELANVVNTIKEKRQEFKAQLAADKEDAKLKIEAMKEKFKTELAKIKDEKKKVTTENIVNFIQELNTKLTNQYSNKVYQIENVLVSVESRIDKAKANGSDVSDAEAAGAKAHDAIAAARDAILAQSKKTYEVNVTDEATLKSTMKTLRDTFSNDIKVVRAKVKAAHQAVKDTATTLAKIPNVNSNSVENTNNENSGQ